MGLIKTILAIASALFGGLFFMVALVQIIGSFSMGGGGAPQFIGGCLMLGIGALLMWPMIKGYRNKTDIYMAFNKDWVGDAKNSAKQATEKMVAATKEWADKKAIEGEDARNAAKERAIKKGEKGMGTIHTMNGVQDQLEVFEDKVTITPKGILGFMNKGLKGTKTIPFSSITAIQFREAGTVISGYLQFTIPGGNESKGGVFSAARDENTFMYKETKNNALAITIKEYIEARVKEFRAPRATQSQSNASLSDELIKLAGLRDSGILSDQEFQSAKNRLIAG